MPCLFAHLASSYLAKDKYPLCCILVWPLRAQTAQCWLWSLSCARSALPQRGRGWVLLRIVARAVPTPVCLEAGKEQAGAENSRLWGWGLAFALTGTMPQGSPNPWLREQGDGSLELPFPCQWWVCCCEKLCWLFWSRCCVWGRHCSLPFLLHPLSSPAKGPVLQLNWTSCSGSRCVWGVCLSSPPHPLFAGSFCYQCCWMGKSVAAIKLETWEYPGQKSEGENASLLPHPWCCLQIKISKLNLNCAFKGLNPLVPSCLCWCLPGCVWAPSAVHLALTPLRLNDKFSLCLLLFVLFCFFSFQPSWHLILPQPVKYNPETCGWENVALCHAHFRGVN